MNKILTNNTDRIIRYIWQNPGISRIELAGKLGLDKSTVSLIVSRLLTSGLLEACPNSNAGPRGGRKKISLRLRSGFGHIAGLEVQAGFYRLVVITLSGDTVFESKVKYKYVADRMADTICEIVDTFKSNHPDITLLGLGIGLTGIVNASRGEILYSIPLQINQPLLLADKVSQSLQLPVLIDNDANCAAWSAISGDVSNFIFILIRFWNQTLKPPHHTIGIGLGMVFGGRLYHGSHHAAGEFKSIFNKKPSGSQLSLPEHALKDVPTDPVNTQKFIEELSANIAMLVNTLDLDKVYLGCDMELHQNYIIDTFYEAIRQNWQYPFQQRYEIEFSKHAENIVALGAATMVLEEAFSTSPESQVWLFKKQ